MTRWVMVRLALFSKLACAKAETPAVVPGSEEIQDYS